MQTLRQSNTEAFLYGFTHLFGGNITQLIEPNLRVLKKNVFEEFCKKSEHLRQQIDKKYEKEIKQLKQTDK